MQRREVLAAVAASALSGGLSGCFPAPQPKPTPWHGAPTDLVDAHCHLFNASDLPTIRFVKIVFLHLYPQQTKGVSDIEDETFTDALVELLAFILGVTGAPTAAEEIAVLRKTQPVLARAAVKSAADAAVTKAVGDYVATHSGAMGVLGEDPSKSIGRQLLIQRLREAAGETGHTGVGAAPIPHDHAQAVAGLAYKSRANIGVYLRWFALVTRYRHVLAKDLYDTHVGQGFTPRLLSPAMIDYDKWLGENVDGKDKSPLPDQVTLMGMLSRRPNSPPIHGYVAFDPLRQAYWDKNVERRFNPIELVKRAVLQEGFVGVKLYPPMGFKPLGNLDPPVQSYPQKVSDKLGGVVGAPLDNAMVQLFDFCQANGASVLAHGGESNGASAVDAQRADPAYWLPVFARWPNLHVSLAHFGSFSSPSAAAPAGAVLPEQSWEWTIGRYIKANPNAPVFTDLSYMTDIFGKTPEGLAKYAALVKRFIAEFDPEVRHLVFGTDWIMLGLEADYPRYSSEMRLFLMDACGLDDAQRGRLFSQNAARFLGLDAGGANRKRIHDFRAAAGLPDLVLA